MDALSDPTRLRLLRLLEQNELGVAELCDVLRLPQSTVSRHLKVLGAGAWLLSRRQATARLYRMLLDELDPAARKLWLVAREQTDGWPAIPQDALRLERLLRDRHDRGRAFFAGAAAQWDRLRQQLYGDRFTDAALLALLPSHYTVADLGCGSGLVAARLAPRVARVIGIDHSAAMLKAARKRLDAFENVDLRQGELTQLPLEDTSCDAALMLLALTYVDDPARALVEMRRILKPGGRAVIVDLLPHDRDDFRRQLGQQAMGFDLAELRSAMEAAGFGEIALDPLEAEPQARGPALFLASATRSGR
jgi:ArsR family transcriptional regulator